MLCDIAQGRSKTQRAESWRPDSAHRRGPPGCLIPTATLTTASTGKEEEEQEPPAVPHITATLPGEGAATATMSRVDWKDDLSTTST